MRTLIKNGILILPNGRKQTDLLLCGDRIEAIGITHTEAERVVDATGCYVLPGFIDPHTHLELSPHLFIRDTQAAVLGGTTSVLEFANQLRGTTMMDGYQQWMKMAAGSTANYGFHMSLSEWNSRQLSGLEDMDRVGVASYKMYMVYDNLIVSDSEIYLALKAIREHGGILGVHCENWDLLQTISEEVYASGFHTAVGHPLSRPAPIEAEAIARFLRIAELAGAPAYVVHLSTKAGLEEIRRARARGQEVYAETCPQYLLLDETRYAEPDGVKYLMSPPLRKPEDIAALWQAVTAGEIDTIGTDHCSFMMQERMAGKDDFRTAPGGCPGIQHRGELMYTYGVCEGRLTMEQLCRVLSTAPAQIFGIKERGSLQSGFFADVVIWDPNCTGWITDTNHAQDCDNTVYAGMLTHGCARDVFVNGEWTVRDRNLVQSGHGRYLHCGPGLHYREITG